MRQDGKCVKRDYGYVGCAADVLAHVDRLCSGEPDHKIAVQCRINAGAIDAAALRPFKNRTMATDEKSLLYFDYDFSGWYNFEKIIKILASRCHILKLK